MMVGYWMETHSRDLEFRLMTIKLLNTIKKKHTYREISQWTGLPVTVLSRYVKGHVLPTSKRAKEIWTSLQKIADLETTLLSRIKFDEMGYFDNTQIVYDIPLLRLATQYVVSKFAGRRINKILTAAVDGIPLATLVANSLDVDLIVAKKAKEVGVKEYIEESYIPPDSGVVVTFYVPKDALKKGDSVLIVDDIIRTGETQEALIHLVNKIKAEVAGIFVLIAVGTEWKNKLSVPPNCPVETLAVVER
ncbi:adenine phosphoribosyltransferase [Candidatus Bathyarchaeota archaeon]|nr:MAG: adenine phosphoribosyltransferase [Candidatus Bathyarchaeota archaeon]